MCFRCGGVWYGSCSISRLVIDCSIFLVKNVCIALQLLRNVSTLLHRFRIACSLYFVHSELLSSETMLNFMHDEISPNVVLMSASKTIITLALKGWYKAH